MTRTIQTLRKQIIKLRDEGMKWIDICRELDIREASRHDFDTGLASMIAYGRKGVLYEPTDPETRRRLGLSIVCKTCKRPIREKKVKQEPRIEPDYILWWKNLGVVGRRNQIRKAHNLYLKENN